MENFEVDSEKSIVIVSVNPKLYPLDAVFSAAYIFTEKCYVLLDGDPLQEIIVELKPKEKSINLEIIGRDFNNELINYANYDLQFKRNARLREIFLQRVMLTHLDSVSKVMNVNQPIVAQDTDYLEKDAKPWVRSKKAEDGKDNSESTIEPSETFV